MSTAVVNLTAHPVIVLDAAGHALATYPPSGTVARIDERLAAPTELATDGGIVPVREVRYAARVQALPDPQPGKVYLVSRVLAAAVKRRDIYFPAGEVRDEAGAIIGCRYLGQFVAGGDDA